MSKWGQWGLRAGLYAAFLVATAAPSDAAPIDKAGEIQLGVRAYSGARVGTEGTDIILENGLQRVVQGVPTRLPRLTKQQVTFPVSSAGSLRQHRFFLEVDWSHDLDRLVREEVGPLGLLNRLPVPLRRVSYRMTYRGEAEGIYDWGPREFRTAEQYFDETLVRPNALASVPVPVDVASYRERLRRIGVTRHRLFQAYAQASAGKVFVRAGRQILVWGETDVFRLLDNINPTDPSFGGFLAPLDERRVPLDMLLLRYNVGRIRPLGMRDVEVEAYGAIDDAVGFDPGIAQGSAWAPPNLGAPSSLVITARETPARNFSDMRGGVRARFGVPVPGIRTADVSLAHYYTYLDLPAIQMVTNFPFPQLLPPGHPGEGASALALQTAPRAQVTGASTTFAVPPDWVGPVGISGEPIIRAEVAYIAGEPRYRQSEIDPFTFALGKRIGTAPGGIKSCPPENTSADGLFCLCSAGEITEDGFCRGPRRTGDSWNAVVGMDLQQRINWLNPDSTFFISTQVFYKHLKGAARRAPIETGGALRACGDPSLPPNATCFADPIPQPHEGEVLPVPEFLVTPNYAALPIVVDAAAPIYVRSPVDQIVHTFLIMTNYFGGRVNPAFGLIYDWHGALVVQPQLTLSKDPFRLLMSYSYLTASRLRGGSGVSLLRDRDNVLFQIEYAL